MSCTWRILSHILRHVVTHILVEDIKVIRRLGHKSWQLFFLWEFHPRKMWNIQMKRQGMDKMYRYLTTLQHFAPHIYYGRCHNITGFLCQNHYSTRNRSKRPQSSYPPRDCPVWKGIIPDSFYHLFVAFSGIPPTENGYFDIRALFNMSYIHPARRFTDNSFNITFCFIRQAQSILCCGHTLWLHGFRATYDILWYQPLPLKKNSYHDLCSNLCILQN